MKQWLFNKLLTGIQYFLCFLCPLSGLLSILAPIAWVARMLGSTSDPILYCGRISVMLAIWAITVLAWGFFFAMQRRNQSGFTLGELFGDVADMGN